MTVKDLQVVLRNLPIAGHFEYPGYIEQSYIDKLCSKTRKNGLCNKRFRVFHQFDNKVMIWRIL